MQFRIVKHFHVFSIGHEALIQFISSTTSVAHSTPNVPVKEHTDNSTTTNSEFNPAYSFELTTNPTQCEVDTFDHILQVTSHHEAVYAYYYMDDDNKVRQKLTEFIEIRQTFFHCPFFVC